jgi:hypothetical protein
MTAFFHVRKADSKSVHIDRIQLEWTTGNRSATVYGNAWNRPKRHIMPTLTKANSSGSRIFDVNETLPWSKQVVWKQTVSISGEGNDVSGLCVGERTIWFRIHLQE